MIQYMGLGTSVVPIWYQKPDGFLEICCFLPNNESLAMVIQLLSKEAAAAAAAAATAAAG